MVLSTDALVKTQLSPTLAYRSKLQHIYIKDETSATQDETKTSTMAIETDLMDGLLLERALSPLRETWQHCFDTLGLEASWNMMNLSQSRTPFHTTSDFETRLESSLAPSFLLDDPPAHPKGSKFSESYFFQWLLCQIEQPWSPLNEIYPFPLPRKKRGGRTFIASGSYGRSLLKSTIRSEGHLQKLNQIFPRDNPEVVAEMERLAGFYYQLGKYGNAESLYRRVALAKLKLLGHDSESTLGSYLDVVEANVYQGRHAHAAILHQDLHETIIQLLGPWIPVAIHSRALSAVIQLSLGNMKDAECLQREVLQIALSRFGQWDAMTCRAKLNLGGILCETRNYAQSEELLRSAIQIQGQISPRMDEVLYQSKLDLGLVLDHQCKHEESSMVMRDSLKWLTGAFGMNHSDTLDGIYRLARSFRHRGKLSESELLIMRNVRRCKKHLGPAHPATLASLRELVDV